MKKIANMVKRANAKAKYLFAALFLGTVAALTNPAAADINGGLTSAASTITGTYDLVSKLCLAIGGVIGLIGGIRVYVLWNNGERDIQKHIVGWAGACLFLLLTGTVLNVFFT